MKNNPIIFYTISDSEGTYTRHARTKLLCSAVFAVEAANRWTKAQLECYDMGFLAAESIELLTRKRILFGIMAAGCWILNWALKAGRENWIKCHRWHYMPKVKPSEKCFQFLTCVSVSFYRCCLRDYNRVPQSRCPHFSFFNRPICSTACLVWILYNYFTEITCEATEKCYTSLVAATVYTWIDIKPINLEMGIRTAGFAHCTQGKLRRG